MKLSVLVLLLLIANTASVWAFAQGSATSDAGTPAVSTSYLTSPNDVFPALSQAIQNTNFSASLVYFRPGQEPIPYKWRVGVDDERTQYEYYSQLNGPETQIVRINEQVSYVSAERAPFTRAQRYIDGPFPHNMLRDPAQFVQAYSSVYVGLSRVAGRKALQYRIVSRDKSRYSYALWLDSQTYLPLKLNTLTLTGEILEQVQVTSLQRHDGLDAFFSELDIAQLPPVIPENPKAAFTLDWQIAQLPVGMVEVHRQVNRLTITGELVEHILLSDGLVDVSVYVQNSQDTVGEDVLLRNQSDTFLSRVVDAKQISVVGKIPAQTANTLVSYVQFSTQTSNTGQQP